MLRGNMKLGQEGSSGHQFNKHTWVRRMAKHWRFGGVFVATILCAMTFSFVSAAPSMHEGGKVTRNEMLVGTAGKIGVSSPKGIATSKAATTPKAMAANAQAIPSKPAWVNMSLFTDPMNGAAQYLATNPSAPGANYISRMSKTPVAQWFGDWNSNVQSDVNAYVTAAAAKGQVPVLVAYNIPNRDCGGYSVGGANGLSIYTQWIQKVAAGIGNRTAVVILEPDALGALDCLPASMQQERTQSLAQGVTTLKSHAQTYVYIDAGTPVWQSTTTMASRLKAANVAAADGFSLNVSYFAQTTQNRTYGDQLSRLIGNKHYVIDTSRNGGNHSVTGMQCNPSFASFGVTPTTNTNSDRNDALLWIKIPWESDGPCNGSPGPGENYWSYAIQLAQNAGW
jgi:endoglucanase